MKIVYASDQYWPSVSGVPVSMDSFKNKFTEKGHEIFLLVPDYPNAVEWDKENKIKNIFRFKSTGIFFNKENRRVCSSEKKKVFETLDSIKPDIIHIHTEFSLAKIVISYAKKKNIPIVMTAHTNWEELVNAYLAFVPQRLGRMYIRFMLQRIFNKADVLIAPTKMMQGILSKYYIQTAVQVIPTGIDENKFFKEKSNSAASHNFVLEGLADKIKDRKVLLYVGRIGKEKNIKFLIDALHQLLPNNKDAKLVIVGEGPAKEELEDYALQLGLQDHVIFTGFVERDKLAEFYSMAHVFTFASKVESQGLVILESMTCGTPVVAIGEMGTKELMGGDFGGFMVEDNLNLFVEKVELLLSDYQLHKLKSEEALQEATKWKIESMTLRVLKLYEGLLV
ncbi:MAG: glycosyltransferase [Bacteriovorax sp.]|nr:glycosyltransferase [Bacteriovorax sp.]